MQGGSCLSELLFLAQDEFGTICAQEAKRLLPELSVRVSRQSDLRVALAAQKPDVVVEPTLTHLGGFNVKNDLMAREAGASYLPITLSSLDMIIGPLFSLKHGCAYCWQCRREQNSKTLAYPLPETTDLNSFRLKPGLASIAISSIWTLIKQAGTPFSSPYILYNLQSRHISHGVLTGLHDCETCRKQLRSMNNGTDDLLKLITTQRHVADVGFDRHER